MSHFTTLVVIENPGVSTIEIQPVFPEKEALIASLKEKLLQNPDDFNSKYMLKILQNMPSPFERRIESFIGEVMEPFWENTDNPEYLEFTNEEEGKREEYERAVCDCVRMPNGTICTSFDHSFTRKFVLKDGIVYQHSFGKLKTNKRTKKARRIKVLPQYPLKKIYKTFGDYMEDYCGCYYNEEHQAYGYTSNPNATWDWYQIGGRWPFQFLVKEDAMQIVIGEYSWAVEDYVREAPAGYKWVAGARKADIEWELMRSIEVENAAKRFSLLEQWFQTEMVPEGVTCFGSVTETGIISWMNQIYVKDETLEEYLFRNGLAPRYKYTAATFSFLEHGEYFSQGDMGWFGVSTNNKDEEIWRQMVEIFIQRVPDNDILVSIDCHI